MQHDNIIAFPRKPIERTRTKYVGLDIDILKAIILEMREAEPTPGTAAHIDWMSDMEDLAAAFMGAPYP